jgi:hypothetical protein
MINPNFTIDNSSINAVKAKVELYNGSTLVRACTCSDILQSFTVDRDEENNKFFGYGVCQKINISLIDLERELTIERGYIVEDAFGDGTNFVYPHPTFHVDEVKRDENSNGITITAYDAIYGAAAKSVEELSLTTPYTVQGVAEACAELLGLEGIEIIGVGATETCFSTSYEEGANFDGIESIRMVLNAIAEVTQTIYYINNNNKLTFKRLDISGDPVYTITKDKYFSLKTGANETLDAICNATELGDNVTAGDDAGTIQYVRENPFWNMRDDVATLLEAALAAVNGLSINQFVCEEWMGDYLLEIGDKIALITEDGGSIYSYVLNDVITFDGTLSENTEWRYEPNSEETPSNPTSLGEKLNQTYAKVDKANKQVTILAGEAEATNGRVSSLELDVNSISSTVSSIETSTKDTIDTMNDNFETLSKQVSMKMSADDVRIIVESELDKGVSKVQTSTGFTFNEEGLNVSKSGSEMTTQITEDGMKILRSTQETLVADNTGVKAENLHATTYLIIGGRSRFEDYEDNRTGCFWIGG